MMMCIYLDFGDMLCDNCVLDTAFTNWSQIWSPVNKLMLVWVVCRLEVPFSLLLTSPFSLWLYLSLATVATSQFTLKGDTNEDTPKAPSVRMEQQQRKGTTDLELVYGLLLKTYI